MTCGHELKNGTVDAWTCQLCGAKGGATTLSADIERFTKWQDEQQAALTNFDKVIREQLVAGIPLDEIHVQDESGTVLPMSEFIPLSNEAAHVARAEASALFPKFSLTPSVDDRALLADLKVRW